MFNNTVIFKNKKWVLNKNTIVHFKKFNANIYFFFINFQHFQT